MLAVWLSYTWERFSVVARMSYILCEQQGRDRGALMFFGDGGSIVLWVDAICAMPGK